MHAGPVAPHLSAIAAFGLLVSVGCETPLSPGREDHESFSSFVEATTSSNYRIALLGDEFEIPEGEDESYEGGWLKWLEDEEYEVELKSLENLGDPGDYALIIYNRPGETDAETFAAVLDGAEAGGTGILFLDTWSTLGNGISELLEHTQNPNNRGVGFSAPAQEMFYRTVAEHPVLSGIDVGEDVPHNPSAGDYAWFTGYEGDGVTILADVFESGYGVRGHGIAVRQNAGNRHVLLSMHGSSIFSAPFAMTTESLQIMRNAIAWAAREASPPPPNGVQMIEAARVQLAAMGVAQGIASSLDAKLRASIESLSNGEIMTTCAQLRALLNELAALERSGRHLTPGQIAALRGAVLEIRAAIDC